MSDGMHVSGGHCPNRPGRGHEWYMCQEDDGGLFNFCRDCGHGWPESRGGVPKLHDPEPQSGDGPDYHIEHAMWIGRQAAAPFRQLPIRANMGVHIPIDPNVRVEHGWTYARLGVGQAVTVYESESGIEGPAIVERIDPDKGFVYLSVKWDQLDGTADMGGVSAEGTEQ